MPATTKDGQAVKKAPPALSTELCTLQQPNMLPPKTTVTETVKLAWETHCSALNLSEQETKDFLAGACDGLPAYLEKIKAVCEQNKDDSLVFNALEWFEPLFKAVELFTPAAQAITQAYPNPGSLVLGGVVGVLSFTGRLAQYQKLTLQNLDRMGRKARILMEYEKELYSHEPSVQKALIQVYVGIMDFCHKAFRIIPDNGNLKAKIKGLKMTTFRDFGSYFGDEVLKFEQRLEDLEQTRSICDSKRLKELYDKRASDQKGFGVLIAEQQAQFKRQDDLSEALWKTEQDLRQQEERKEKRAQKARALHWLSPLNFQGYYQEKCEDHLPGTGEWLLESELYKTWRGGDESDLLWISGKPGCGKSVLAARTVADLSLQREPGMGFAFAFCRKADRSSQNFENVMGALAKQICEEQPEIDPGLEKEYSAYSRPEKPNKAIVRNTMKSALLGCRKTFIVVDALDELESSSGEDLAQELISLVQDGALPSVKVIVFSRQDSLEKLFRAHKQIHPDRGANDADLTAYIQFEFADDVEDDEDRKRHNQEIRDLCNKKAQGMFLWVKLLAQNLKKPGMTSKMKLKKIEDIPSGLTGIYDRIINDINKQDEEVKKIAFLVLLWVTHAQKALTGLQMLEAVADFEGVSRLEQLEASKPKNPEELVSICMNLVYVDQDNYFRVCHDSVRGYLDIVGPETTQALSEYRLQKARAHERLAEICLRYLLLDNFECGPAKTTSRLLSIVSKSCFLPYAADCWAYHASQNLTPSLEELILKLAFSRPRRELSMQLALSLRSDDDEDDLWTHPGTSNHLHFLALFGLSKLAETLLDRHPAALSHEADGSGATPLFYAMRGGHHDMSLWLVDYATRIHGLELEVSQRVSTIHYGAVRGWLDVLKRLIRDDVSHINSRMGRDGSTPLVRSCATGELETADFLINSGADVNLRNGNGESPLLVAALNGHAHIVALLLKRGADPNCRDDLGNTPLHYVAESGNMSTAEALLEHGANPQIKSTSADEQTPLHIAAEVQSLDLVRALHRTNADLDARSSQRCTPLHVAAWHNSAKSAGLLLELGAAKDEIDDDGRTALFIAANEGFLETVKVLAQGECSVNIVAKDGKTAIHAAASCGKVEVLRTVLKVQPFSAWKSLVSQRSNDNETALHLALTEGKVSMVKWLLKVGADPAADGLLESSTLHYAAHFGHRLLPYVLLEKTKDPNPRNRDDDTPLHFAARACNYSFIIQFFQDCAALGLTIDINARNRWGKTALTTALSEKCEKVAKFLLKQHALSYRDNDGNYPIHLAAYNGFNSIVKELLSHEGSRSKGYQGRTAFYFAASQGHLKMVKLLLNPSVGGKEVLNMPDDTLTVPLASSLWTKHLKVANYLLDHGADHAAVDDAGDSLLHIAAAIGDLAMALRLLKMGCPGDVRNKVGETPLLKAVSANSEEIVDALVAEGFNTVNVVNSLGNAPITTAAGEGNLEMLQKLDQHGATHSVVNLLGRTASYSAAEGGHVEVMSFLKEHGDDFSLPDFEGNTPLMEASGEGQLAMVAYLLESGAASVNGCNTSRMSPLSGAARRGNPLTITRLLEAGADPNHRDAWGLTSLDYASRHRPSLREMHKVHLFYNPDNHEAQADTVHDTIRRCCVGLMERSSEDDSVKTLYNHLTLTLDLARALLRAQDYDRVKICYMELYWPMKIAVLAVTYRCDFCGTRSFTGDKYVCKSCYSMINLCFTCHKDYVTAGREVPEAIREIIELEKEVQRLRQAIAAMPSLIGIASAVQYFMAGAKWLSVALELYEDWEQKYNSTKKYSAFDRPGYDLLKMVGEVHTLVEGLGRDDDVDAENIEKMAKLSKEYRVHRRKHRAHQEIADITCKDHEFVCVSIEEQEQMKAEGKNLDSETGRLTQVFLRGTLDRYKDRAKVLTRRSDPISPEWTLKAPIKVETRNLQGKNRDEFEDEDSSKPRGLKRSSTMAEKKPVRQTTVGGTLTSSSGTKRDLAEPTSKIVTKRALRRSQTLPITSGQVKGIKAETFKIEMKSAAIVAAAEARLHSQDDASIPTVPRPTVERNVSVSFDTQPQHSVALQSTSVVDGDSILNSPLSPEDTVLSQTFSEEPQSLTSPDPGSQAEGTASPTGTDEASSDIVEQALRDVYLVIHNYEEDDDDMVMWRFALDVTEAMIPGFMDNYFKAKAEEKALREEEGVKVEDDEEEAVQDEEQEPDESAAEEEDEDEEDDGDKDSSDDHAHD